MLRALIHQSSYSPACRSRQTETRDTGTLRLEDALYPTTEVVRARTRAGRRYFIWHLVEGQGCRRQAACWGALTRNPALKREFRREGLCLLGADLQTGRTGGPDAEPRFEIQKCKAKQRGHLASDLTEAEAPARTARQLRPSFGARGAGVGGRSCMAHDCADKGRSEAG